MPRKSKYGISDEKKALLLLPSYLVQRQTAFGVRELPEKLSSMRCAKGENRNRFSLF